MGTIVRVNFVFYPLLPCVCCDTTCTAVLYVRELITHHPVRKYTFRLMNNLNTKRGSYLRTESTWQRVLAEGYMNPPERQTTVAMVSKSSLSWNCPTASTRFSYVRILELPQLGVARQRKNLAYCARYP